MDALQIDMAIGEGCATLTVAGELDGLTAHQLDDALRVVASEQRAMTVVLDLAHLVFVDSAGLSVLIAAHKRLTSNDSELRLVGARPSVRKVFEIAGLDRVLTIAD